MARTPGPWRVFNGEYIVQEHPTGDMRYITKVYGDDDARLIAAAPEMLEALLLYNRTYASTQRHPSAIDEADCIIAVRAAIAKATGQ